MLRKCAAALAVSLVCLSGQAFAQQSTAKVATTSAVERIGAQSGQSNEFGAASPWLLYVIFGIATVGIIVAANDSNDSPVSK